MSAPDAGVRPYIAGEKAVSRIHINGKSASISEDPFRHCVIDDLWSAELLSRVREEFPAAQDQDWIVYQDPEHEEKLEGPSVMFGAATRELVAAIEAAESGVREAFGLPPMVLSTEGGGYHQTNPGGGLAVHADFNRSEDGLYRRVNVIIYLNLPHELPAGGELELWDQAGPVVTISPAFNRTVIFETSDASFHGHPRALRGSHPRRSFAAYFFTRDRPVNHSGDHSTVWHPKGKRVPA
jgi:hypothetical protein